MKNMLIAGSALVAVAVVAAGGWYVYGRGGNPLDNARSLLAKGDARGAVIELRNAVKADPTNAEAHFRLGEMQQQGGDSIAAEKELKLARELNYNPALVTPLLGQSYLAQRRFQDLLTDVPAEGGTPELTAKYLVLRSMAQVGLRDVPGAKASLDAAERAAPRDVDVRLAETRLALLERNTTLAERKIDEAIALDDKRGDALVLKGQLRAAGGDATSALDLMDKAVLATPANPLIKLERANLLLTSGQDAKAQADVDAVLAQQPRSAPAMYLKAVLLIRGGKFAEADTELANLGPTIQQFPRALYFQAIAKANTGQTESAVDAANRYIVRAPNDLDGVRLLARIEITAKRPARAVEALTKAIAAGAKDPETLDLLGRAYAAAGEAPKAAETFQQAADAAPKDPVILTNLAASRMQLGDSFGASRALERSLDIQPNQANAGEALVATALSSGDVERASAALERLRAQAGNTESVGLLSGLIRLARQDLEGARAEFQGLTERFPQSVNAKINLAKVLILQGKRPEGEALLNGILAKEPANPQALNTLLQIQVQEGRLAPAITAVEAARKAQPQDEGLTVAQSDLLIRSNDAKKALEVLNAARVNGQLSPALMMAQARAQFASGAVDDAKATYRQVLLAQPNELEARRALTEMLINKQDFQGAKDVLRDGLRTAPGNLGMMTTMVMIEQRASGTPAAITMAEELRRDQANMPAATVLKGDALMAAKRYVDAAAAYGEEVKTTPSSTLIQRQSQALAAAGGMEQASNILRDWLKRTPGDADAAQMLAAYAITARHLPEAEEMLKVVLDKRPNDGMALNNLAWVYQQRGNGLARSTAQRAYLLSPTAETADTLGWILVSDGKADQAMPLLSQAAIQRPDEPNIAYHLAKAQADAGKKDDAVATLKKTLATPNDFEERRPAMALLEQLSKK